MEPAKVVSLLEGTINPTLRKDCEEQLESMRKIAGFAPLLLQIIMSEEVNMAVRQAGAIYMKNTCTQWWHERDGGAHLIFHIHEDDKVPIRDNIVEAITIAPDIIRNQLTVILSTIIKHDYPGKWPAVVDKISLHLQGDDPKTWMGALLTLYQLTKNYEYTKAAEKAPLIEAMKLFIQPLLFLLKRLVDDNAASSVLIQKQILKILYALIQYSLPLELFTKEVLDEWMILIKSIIERPVPPEVEQMLDNYRKGVYMSPRVLQQTLHFISQGVSHAHTWKVIRNVFEPVLREIVFPLMCFTDEDQEVWEDDPHEYLRRKFDVFEDFLSPASAAQCLLLAACKRKQMLQKTMGLCYSVLTSADGAQNPRRKDGSLHIIGTLAETLLKRKIYKDQMEMMLTSYVVPEFKSPHGFLRARACWVAQLFSEVKFKKDANIISLTNALRLLLVNDPELPVKVESAIALQTILCDQPKAEKHCQPHVRELMMNLLMLVHETSNDDLTSVVQKLICLYCEECIPLAVEITQNLAQTFMKMLGECETGEEDDESEDKSVAALGVLNTIETVLDMMEEERNITVQLEGIVTPVVAHVLKNRNIDFYEDTLSLLYSITCQAISPNMWEGLLLLYEVFDDDGFDYFTDMMPCLHNFVTVDTEAFLSNPRYLEIMYSMCKKILENDAGEDPESHAAKLIEVIILQCKGRIDQCIPLLIELALSRLTKEIKMKELRTMCLQVVIASLYYNPHLLISTLEQMRFPNTTESISNQFFSQWFNDIQFFLGIHDRRVCVLGLCTLLSLQNRTPAIDSVSAKIVPSLISLFQGLVKAYKTRGDGEDSDGSDSESEDEGAGFDEEQELSSSEDEIDEESAEYLEMLEKKAEDFANCLDDDDDDEDFGETTLEPYSTPLEADDGADEFIIFKTVFSNLEKSDPNFYAQLIAPLNAEQRKSLQDVYNLADQRKAAAESKKIEKTGGYQFNVTNIPTTFQFGSGMPSTLSP